MHLKSNCMTLLVPVLALLLLSSLSGCGHEMTDEERLQIIHGEINEVVPVGGTVKINGAPEQGVMVILYDQSGAKLAPMLPAITDENGKFDFTTYVTADGVAPGTYVVTFKWHDLVRDKKLGNKIQGADKLKNMFADPKKSPHSFTVESSQPLEDLDFNLTL